MRSSEVPIKQGSCDLQRLSITRPSAEKRLDKTLVLVDVNHLRLLADLPEKLKSTV